MEPTLPPRKPLEKLLALALAAVRANQGSFLLADSTARTLRFFSVVSRGGLAAHAALFEPLVGQAIRFGDGITGKAADVLAPVWSTPRDAFHRIPGDASPAAVMAVPVLSPSRTLLGVMTAISFDRERRFGPAEAEAYSRHAELAACFFPPGADS